jgi:hypothetical protein
MIVKPPSAAGVKRSSSAGMGRTAMTTLHTLIAVYLLLVLVLTISAVASYVIGS